MSSAVNARDRSARRSATGERTRGSIQLFADAKMVSEVGGAEVGVEQSAPEPGRVLEEHRGGAVRRPTAVAPVTVGPIAQPAASDGVPITVDEGDHIVALHWRIIGRGSESRIQSAVSRGASS